jgi:DNA invertase Pin-like site-specific DNA recombinase
LDVNQGEHPGSASMKKGAPTLIVGYRRTSTKDQRLGIESQDARLAAIASEKTCSIDTVFTEHESGGDNARPELDRAIRHARRINAYLVVAKLDRLARDSTFLMKLYDGNVPIIFGDLPDIDGSAASRLMLQVMSSIAEFERRRIGERTRDALAILKARGVKLGNPANLTPEAIAKGSRIAAERRTARAIDEMSDVAEFALKMRREGASLWKIAHALNDARYLTRQGRPFSATQVKRVLDRLKPPAGRQPV